MTARETLLAGVRALYAAGEIDVVYLERIVTAILRADEGDLLVILGR